jgi:peptide/nickel transport system substrate-binding protein
VPAGVRSLSRPGLKVYYIGLNVRDVPTNPFRDVRVRRALHLGIDREAMVEKALSRRAAVATQPVAPAVFGYDPDVSRPLYDPAQARELLAQAGHGKGLRARLDVAVARAAVGRVLQDQLRAIGAELELNPVDNDAVYQLGVEGKSDLFLIGWDCSTGEASEFYEFCLHTPAGQYGKGNYGGYSNREIDTIAETNANILDPRARRRLLQKAAVIMAWASRAAVGVGTTSTARPEVTFRPRRFWPCVRRTCGSWTGGRAGALE